MPRTVRGALIQATLCEPATSPPEKIKRAMIDKHLALIAQAADQGAQVVCLQELFYGPYFCAEQQTKWYDLVERIPDGPTTKLMCDVAKKHGIGFFDVSSDDGDVWAPKNYGTYECIHGRGSI